MRIDGDKKRHNYSKRRTRELSDSNIEYDQLENEDQLSKLRLDSIFENDQDIINELVENNIFSKIDS